MINSKRFWSSNYYKHPPIDDNMIAEAENKFGVVLPVEFLDLLRIQNGGYTRGFAFPMEQKTSWAKDYVPLNELFGIVVDEHIATSQNVLETEYMTNEWGLPERQVLLAGEGHWWITLDYRKRSVPSVRWLDVDSGEDIEVAESFSKFIDGLVSESNYRREE